MPILPPVTSPFFHTTRLSHVTLTSRDLELTRAFYEAGLGLEVTDHTDTHLALRAIEEASHHSILFEKKGTPGPGLVRAIGYRVLTEDDLDRAFDHFAGQGANPEFVDRPWQGRTLRLSDAVGVPLEFCATMETSEPRLRKYHEHVDPRLAYLDHIQIVTHDVQAAYEWYTDLGFRLTEYTATDGTEELWGVWLKRKNNTQDVVFSNGPGPRLHHFAFHTPEIASIIHGADRMAALGLANMDRPPARHGISNAFFAYYRDPDGHRVETFTSHYNVIDIDHEPTRWDLSDTSRSQVWGFPAPRKWFVEASEFEGVPQKDPTLSAPPVTLEDFLATL